MSLTKINSALWYLCHCESFCDVHIVFKSVYFYKNARNCLIFYCFLNVNVF